MKRSKEELKQRVGELVQDNDIAIQLLEDIEDSMEEGELDTSKIDELQAKFDDLQKKYKERFLKTDDKKTEEKEEDTDEKGLEEKEVIDIKEI